VSEPSVERCVVKLRIEFLGSGKVGKVERFSTTCSDQTLIDQAIQAANKLEFEPKRENGQAIAVTKVVEYTFSPIDDWPKIPNDPEAEKVLRAAIGALGGERYLNVKTQIGRGKFSEITKEGVVVSFRSFVDVIVYPNKERTEFKGQGLKNIQVNVGDTGWVFDGSMEVLRDQNETQIANFKMGFRTSLDHLLRGEWKSEGKVSYVTRRAGALGRRNDVIRLTYNDGLVVDFEFGAADGLPVKAMYTRTNADSKDIKEEDRYAQFIET